MAAVSPKPELLVIVGQTASGKSALALQIAKEINGEIICADSWTVYKHFNIGTSKPTISQQKAVKHWLLDVREANQGFNAPAFKELAQKAITDIQDRGKLPIMVGGTGLYIDSVLYDFGFLPSVSPDERAKLDSLELAELLGIAKLQNIDLTDIDIRNKRRVIRAIEAKGQKPTKQSIRPNTLIIGLQPDTEELKTRVEQRVDQMLADGLEKEVKQLSVKYGWEAEPMKGIGYREWQNYFNGSQSLEETRQRIISATNNLSKRQRTWFKRNRDINWFSDSNQAYEYVKKQLLNT
ncbi:tRNA (adenosine(37)-N6)-dimethylallyltransferase MiaA [Candidatus Saccharibacteria bacterium]|nr:tRNA (adenosine(37)-N6)-dimethylallyltransferase MiaA [Candidatus Saccharibacteria bacterium]